MQENNVLWECQPRTKAKLEILRSYLGAWFSILAAKNFPHVYYIDGFCGPGEYLGGEEGSPVIAARLASSSAQKYPGFKATLVFIDRDSKALNHLRSLKVIRKQHPNVKIEIREGVFADEIEEVISNLGAAANSPIFSFVDPFGFGQSPFNKLQTLLPNQSSEIFVNFMCGFMNRFKEHDDPEVTEKIRNMVGEESLDAFVDAQDPIGAFCEAFERNLKNIGQYTLKFAMRDEKNIRDNAFFFCGRNSKGFEKIKEAMWKIDPIHGNSFSAYREQANSGPQENLFDTPAQTHPLSSALLSKFAGRKGVSVEEVFRWVIDDTETYLPKHARVELEHLLSRGAITSVVDPIEGARKRRENAWPKRLMLDFADSA